MNKNGNPRFDYTFHAQAIAEIETLFQQRQAQQQTWVDTMQQQMNRYARSH